MIALHALRDSPPHVLRRPSRPAKGNCPGASAVAPFARGGLPALPRGTFGHRASIIACGKPQRNLNFLFVCMLPPRGHICQVLFGRAGLILDIHAKTYFKYAQLCKKPQRKRGYQRRPSTPLTGSEKVKARWGVCWATVSQMACITVWRMPAGTRMSTSSFSG